MKCQFNSIRYRYSIRKPQSTQKRITVLGIDSESYDNGVPFMFAISDGTITTPEELFDTLFQHKYRGIKFVCYNLKYDEGSILHQFPSEVLQELRQKGKIKYNDYSVRSIPKKELVITNIKQKHSIAFYDIAQFYGTSLNKASLYYLGKEKTDMPTKTFSRKYVKKAWQKLSKYCIQDAKLTEELADYFIDMLITDFDIYPQKLYSTGYIAGLHFARTCDVIDVKRYYRYYKECLEYAYLSYAGGKFETYQRGFGIFYQYDINSAYPYEISNLQDIRTAKVFKSNEYQKDAAYGFINCRLMLSNDYSPIPLKIDNVNRYPIGSFSKIITKFEYDYLIERGDRVEIIDAWWIVCQAVEYPYKKEVERLFELKRRYKKTDTLRYMLVKILLNSFYGKFIQVTHKIPHEGRYEAGWLFNPIYGSVISANTRVRLCRVCEKYDKYIVAVATDSIVTTIDLHNNGLDISDNLGDWKAEDEGYGVVVGSGVYQIGDNTHFRGYHGLNDLTNLVKNNRNRINISVNQRLVLSWRLVVFRNADPDLINRFTQNVKVLNLHFDRKREWDSGWKWTDQLVSSLPFIEVEAK